jgi:hypothetical protein
MCQRALPVTHSGHNNVWCSFCGAYTNTILVTAAVSSAGHIPSGNAALFWEMVEIVLCHPSLQRAPIESRENLGEILSRHRELWSKEHMITFLSKEEFFLLCSSL